ncbi:RING-type E3 ubiquitin transferase [Ranunculus cassubicifolius]
MSTNKFDFIGEVLMSGGVHLGVGLACMANILWVSYKSCASKFEMIHGTREIPISGLRSIISQSSSLSSSDNGFVITRGRVQPMSEPLLIGSSDASTPQPDVLMASHGFGEKRAVLQKITEICVLEDGERLRSTSLKNIPFVLAPSGTVGGDSASDYVRVNLDGLTHKLPLSKVYDMYASTIKEPLSGRTTVCSEEILPIGTEITAIGSVCISEDGTPQIRGCKELPYFLSKMTKAEMLIQLRGGKSVCFWGTIIFGSLSLGVFVYAGRKILRRWKQWKMRQTRIQHLRDQAAAEIQNGIDNIGSSRGGVLGGPSCVLCLSRRRTFLFVPCGHLVCCGTCALSLQENLSPTCPTCGGTISNTIKLYE